MIRNNDENAFLGSRKSIVDLHSKSLSLFRIFIIIAIESFIVYDTDGKLLSFGLPKKQYKGLHRAFPSPVTDNGKYPSAKFKQ